MIQLCIFMGMNDCVERVRECDFVGRAGRGGTYIRLQTKFLSRERVVKKCIPNLQFVVLYFPSKAGRVS